MADLPLVTIGIPVKNGANYLDEAVRSAFAQVYKNIEILIVDDGSDDGNKTWECISAYGDRVRAIRQTNKGVAGALNSCIKNMRGEFFSWLSHDDLYSPVKISTQMEFYKKNPSFTGVLFSSYTRIGEDGQIIGEPTFDRRYLSNIFYTILATYIHGCSLIVPKQSFEKVGIFAENLQTVCDNDLWLRMALSGIPFYFQPFSLVYARDHGMRATYSLHDIHLQETTLFFVNAMKKLLPYIKNLDSGILEEILIKRHDAAPALAVLRAAVQRN